MLTLTQVQTIYTDIDPKPARKPRGKQRTAKQRKELVDKFTLENRLSGISAQQFEINNNLANSSINKWKKRIYGGKND